MVVNFEFFGDEPIENLITCMNFKVDKVVFWGYNETMDKDWDKIDRFLKEHCGVGETIRRYLSHSDLQSMLKVMRTDIRREIEAGNRIYFDITGGESLILVAFGMLSKEFETPMHMFNIREDRLIELDEGAASSISREVPMLRKKLTLGNLIEMHGGVINMNLHKGIKVTDDPAFMADAEKIYSVASEDWEKWNPFSAFLRNNMVPDEDLWVSRSAQTVINALSSSNSALKNIGRLNGIVDALADEGILTNVVHSDGHYQFRYKNQNVKDCLWDGGSILELHTYGIEADSSDECRVGVHLDWDGITHEQYGVDVLNEIDVLSIKGNVPTFISCKSGKMEAAQTLHALYELETVAERFGGKYARKVLVSAAQISGVYLERASEMGIEVR